MKYKSTLALWTLLVSCFFSVIVNAQKQKKNSSFFDLEILQYSDKPDSDKEHYHLVKLTNNSNKIAEFELFAKQTKCKDAYENVVDNQKGKEDNNEDENYANKEAKNNSSLTYEIYNQAQTKKLERILLPANESVNLYLKISRINNSDAGQFKCSKFITKFFSKNNEKKKKRSVIIKTFIPDFSLKGH